jgi:non-specific serine/threonine protein kinase/serine/threonine-protein kinase
VLGDPVTTVSDVYTLGALLYEILAGRPPHRFLATQPTRQEMNRVICDEEPLRPSLAAKEPEMRRALRGDLDTIVLRALSKLPARRYSSAATLAHDLRRYLEGRPVRARRDTTGYRVRKFLGRNKAAVGAAAVFVVALLAGSATTLWHAQRAERRFNDVRGIANSLMFEFHDSIKDLPGGLGARQLVTQRGLEYLDRLASEAGDDPSIRSELAAGYSQLGRITFDIQESIAAHRKAVAVSEALVEAVPKNREHRRLLAESYDGLSDMLKIAGESRQAIDCARTSLAVMQSLAADSPGDLQVQRDLAERHQAVANVLLDVGDVEGALATAREVLRIEEKAAQATSPDDADGLRRLYRAYALMSYASEENGDYSTALEYSRKGSELIRRNFDREPTNATFRRDAWASALRTGRQLAAVGESELAFRTLAEATELMEGLAAADPNDKGHRRWLAVTYSCMANLYSVTARPTAALERYREAIKLSEELLANDSGRIETQRDLAKFHQAVGVILTGNGEHAAALEHLHKALALAQASAAHDQENAAVRSRLADVWASIGALHRARADQARQPSAERVEFLRAAVTAYNESLRVWQTVERTGLLSHADTRKPGEVMGAIADCEAALHVSG